MFWARFGEYLGTFQDYHHLGTWRPGAKALLSNKDNKLALNIKLNETRLKCNHQPHDSHQEDCRPWTRRLLDETVVCRELQHWHGSVIFAWERFPCISANLRPQSPNMMARRCVTWQRLSEPGLASNCHNCRFVDLNTRLTAAWTSFVEQKIMTREL